MFLSALIEKKKHFDTFRFLQRNLVEMKFAVEEHFLPTLQVKSKSKEGMPSLSVKVWYI